MKQGSCMANPGFAVFSSNNSADSEYIYGVVVTIVQSREQHRRSQLRNRLPISDN